MQRLILSFVSSLSLPFFTAYSLFKPRLRNTLYERLGFGGWSDFKRPSGKLLWIHAASLGEVNGVIPVIKKLKEVMPEIVVVGTTSSDTGKDALLKHLKDVLVLPFDHPVIVAKALNLVKPDLIAISETEIWPSFILEASSREIPIVYFNARISDYTFKNYKLFASFLKPILSAVKALYAQTRIDLERFSELGIGQATLTGSTKSDLGGAELTKIELNELSSSFGIKEKDICLVAGSVHPGEDLAILEVYQKLKQDIKNLKLIIAPRHNFDRVAELLLEKGISFSRRTSAEISDVCLLDTIGELSKVYALATVAYVGGSLVDIGGHNPFEPAMHGVPVVIGKHIATVRDSVEALKNKNAIFIVNNKEQLYQVLADLFLNPQKILEAGVAAKEVLRQSRGATEQVVEGFKPFLLAQRG